MTKIKGKLKELQQPIARTENEIYRGKTRRRAAKKGKRILEKGHLINIEDRSLEELRYIKVKLNKARTRNAKIRNNLFNEDGRFYRNIKNIKVKIGKTPHMKTFVDFWAGIREDETTPSRKQMVEIAEKIT